MGVVVLVVIWDDWLMPTNTLETVLLHFFVVTARAPQSGGPEIRTEGARVVRRGGEGRCGAAERSAPRWRRPVMSLTEAADRIQLLIWPRLTDSLLALWKTA